MKYEKIDRKGEQGSAGKQFAHFVKVGYNRARQVNHAFSSIIGTPRRSYHKQHHIGCISTTSMR
jgi:predicted metal-dependent HD superfamily phosphohydrolase